ncbi:hypothetical protein QQ045_019896 [Rhodiola kirilowii]
MAKPLQNRCKTIVNCDDFAVIFLRFCGDFVHRCKIIVNVTAKPLQITANIYVAIKNAMRGDPTGFTLADTLACSTVGHIIGVGVGVGVVFGLKNIGAI